MHLLKELANIFYLLTFMAFVIRPAAAQDVRLSQSDSLKKKAVLSFAAGFQRGFIFAHSPEVENTKGAHPSGIELIFSLQRNDPASWELCNCFPRRGLLVAYYDYDSRILGRSLTAAYFLEPAYKIANRSFFSFRGAAGASLLTNPFDSIQNSTNRSYSTRLNAYLLLGVGGWFNIKPQWWLNASINYQHISNGGTKQPNKGINWPTAGIAVSYQPGTTMYKTREKSKLKTWVGAPVRWDVTLFGNARKSSDASGKRKRSIMAGTGVLVAKQVGRINNLTTSVEIFKDAALKATLRRDSLSVSAVKAGWMMGHEFILGKFLFSQRLGIYVFDQTPYYDLLFHRWGLLYRINNQAGVGFNLQAHRQVADFIDLRFTYILGRE